MKLILIIILFAHIFPNSDSIHAYDGDSLFYTINIGEEILVTMIDGKEYYGSLHSNSYENNLFQLKYNQNKHTTFFSKRKINYDEVKFIQVGEGKIEIDFSKRVLTILASGASGAILSYLSTYIFMPPNSCGMCGSQGGIPAIFIRTFVAGIGASVGLVGGVLLEPPPESYGKKLRISCDD